MTGLPPVDAEGFPNHVATGEQIRSPWGNAVVDRLRDTPTLRWLQLSSVPTATINMNSWKQLATLGTVAVPAWARTCSGMMTVGGMNKVNQATYPVVQMALRWRLTSGDSAPITPKITAANNGDRFGYWINAVHALAAPGTTQTVYLDGYMFYPASTADNVVMIDGETTVTLALTMHP